MFIHFIFSHQIRHRGDGERDAGTSASAAILYTMSLGHRIYSPTRYPKHIVGGREERLGFLGDAIDGKAHLRILIGAVKFPPCVGDVEGTV